MQKWGDELEGGDVLGTVQETIVVTQKIMVPPNMKGTLKEIRSGEFTVDETVAVLSTADGDKELTLMQALAGTTWPSIQEKTSAGKTSGNRPACY